MSSGIHYSIKRHEAYSSREGSSYLYLVKQKDVYNLLSELSLLKLGKKKKIPTRRDYECKRSHEAHDIGLVIEKETLL